MMTAITTKETLLVLTAVQAESDQLVSALSQKQTLRCGHLTIHTGTIGTVHLTIACCGIGKACAAAATALLVNQLNVYQVLMIGCAGAYPEGGLKIGDLAIASEEIMGDEGVATPLGFLTMEQLGFAIVENEQHSYYHRFPTHTDDRRQTTLATYAADQQIQCLTGPFVTVSTCSGTADAGQQLYQRTQGLVENMEGAAVAQVCAQYQIPFTEMRAISNMVEDRNMAQWDLLGAMSRAQRAALQVIDTFEKESQA